jgi:signal transduction histidine kinase
VRHSHHGAAISDESLAHIFKRFFRAYSSRTRGSGGAGIGLAIARELVEAHYGRVGGRSDAEG